jgi:hypothetical protein
MLSQFALPLCTEALALKVARRTRYGNSLRGWRGAVHRAAEAQRTRLKVRGATTKVTGTVVVMYESSPLDTRSEIEPV